MKQLYAPTHLLKLQFLYNINIKGTLVNTEYKPLNIYYMYIFYRWSVNTLHLYVSTVMYIVNRSQKANRQVWW